MNTKIQLTGQAKKLYIDDGNVGFLKRRKTKSSCKKLIVVAEGDSWFDYPLSYLTLGKDLLGHLRSFGKVDIFRVSKAGDTLENMSYGSSYDSHFKPADIEINETLSAIKKYQPDIFLLSAGGNDVSGESLASYLNHSDSNLDMFRIDYMNFVLDNYMYKMYKTIINSVIKAKPDIEIFIHGYHAPVPDGRGTGIDFLNWYYLGPWLLPYLVQKRILDKPQQQYIMKYFIDRLNDTIKKVCYECTNVHYVDFRGSLKTDSSYKKDWDNELHPTSAGFLKVAKILQNEIDNVFDDRPRYEAAHHKKVK